MTTNAKLGAQLLRDAATFFDTVGEQNPAISDRMTQNAEVYRQVAEMVETDPTGLVNVESGND